MEQFGVHGGAAVFCSWWLSSPAGLKRDFVSLQPQRHCGCPHSSSKCMCFVLCDLASILFIWRHLAFLSSRFEASTIPPTHSFLTKAALLVLDRPRCSPFTCSSRVHYRRSYHPFRFSRKSNGSCAALLCSAVGELSITKLGDIRLHHQADHRQAAIFKVA